LELFSPVGFLVVVVVAVVRVGADEVLRPYEKRALAIVLARDGARGVGDRGEVERGPERRQRPGRVEVER
jgi:hypothetical protein